MSHPDRPPAPRPTVPARSSVPPIASTASAGLFALVGCAAAPPPQPARGLADGRTLQVVAPYSGGSREDAVVRVVGPASCTGALVREQVVLTAHHCVAERDRFGRPRERSVAPEALTIEVGGGDLPWAEAKVRAIVAPQCGYAAGDGDIALLVLDRPLSGMEPLAVDLDDAPRAGEAISVSGFGVCTEHRGGIVRHRRSARAVDRVGSGDFSAMAAICPGDSGGPVRRKRGDELGAIVGVVSSSVMDNDPRTEGRSYFTRLDRWRTLFAAADALAQGTPAAELPPFDECAGW